MQQTTTYKLNLIEADDVFSPEPLSENARKVDAALSSTASALAAETAARKSADTAGTAAWQRAVSDEAAARQKAVSDEAALRQKAIAAETAARQSADAALDRRLKVFEAHRAASGTYTAKDSKLPIEVNLGFPHPRARGKPQHGLAPAGGYEHLQCQNRNQRLHHPGWLQLLSELQEPSVRLHRLRLTGAKKSPPENSGGLFC